MTAPLDLRSPSPEAAAASDSAASPRSKQPLRILFVASRHPGGRAYGRIMVLRSSLSALTSLGHDVTLAVCQSAGRQPTGTAPSSFWNGLPVRLVPLPSPARAAFRAAGAVPRRRRSLNECLYDGRAGRAAIDALVAEVRPDVVVADTIRTVPLLEHVGVPLVVDLDDLLSVRYRQAPTGRAERDNLLGYYGDTLPAPLRPLASRLAMGALSVEAALLARREAQIARLAEVTTVVSPDEAAALARSSGRAVATTPLAVELPEQAADPAAAPAGSALFVGRMDYAPNRRAVEWFAGTVLPRLPTNGTAPFRLRVVGHCPDPLRHQLERRGVDVAGYVDDLASEMAGHRLFVAPIVSGSGVNVKVLDAMAAGLPVVGTPRSVAGMAPDIADAALVADDPESYAGAIRRLMEDPSLARSLGVAGRTAVARHHAPAVTRQRWAELLEAAQGIGAAALETWSR